MDMSIAFLDGELIEMLEPGLDSFRKCHAGLHGYIYFTPCRDYGELVFDTVREKRNRSIIVVLFGILTRRKT